MWMWRQEDSLRASTHPTAIPARLAEQPEPKRAKMSRTQRSQKRARCAAHDMKQNRSSLAPRDARKRPAVTPVSYTHLTLPTICSV
eukprot:2637344-Prymnesium_polylepis.1